MAWIGLEAPRRQTVRVPWCALGSLRAALLVSADGHWRSSFGEQFSLRVVRTLALLRGCQLQCALSYRCTNIISGETLGPGFQNTENGFDIAIVLSLLRGNRNRGIWRPFQLHAHAACSVLPSAPSRFSSSRGMRRLRPIRIVRRLPLPIRL